MVRRGINLAALQIEGLQLETSLAHTVHLGMCRRIEVDGYAVGSLSDEDAVLGDNCPERSATGLQTIL